MKWQSSLIRYRHRQRGSTAYRLQAIVTCPTYADKFIRDSVVAPSVLLQVVIVTLPCQVWLSEIH